MIESMREAATRVFRLLPVAAVALAARRAGEGDLVGVDVACSAPPLCDFSVTRRHADTGWDHYANRWEVVAEDGSVLRTRVLRHPRVEEQPFTRSLRGVKLSPGSTHVVVRAHDSVHALGGREVRLEVPEPTGAPAPGSP